MTATTVSDRRACCPAKRWRRSDFKELGTDEGFYTFDDKLQFVIVAGATFETGLPRWLPGVTYRVTLTRDASGLTIGYLDDEKQWHFSDDAGWRP